MSILEIGCCGAYCGTCKVFKEGQCKGCKLGYDTGERDITKAKCKMKKCCFAEKHYQTCADCGEYEPCLIIGEFYGHTSTKYKKYKQANDFIRKNGYETFLKQADTWKNAYGKLVDTE